MAIPCPEHAPTAWDLYKADHPERAPWTSCEKTARAFCRECSRAPGKPEEKPR